MQTHKSKMKLRELEIIITKMPLNACCIDVVPEFGVKWRNITQAVRNARLPMVASSVARVLCQYAAKSLHQEDVDDILGRLRLKLVATQCRQWHVIRLLDPTTQIPVTKLLRVLPHRVLTALREGKHRNMRPKVQSVTLGDLLYLSIQFVSEYKESSVVYLCTVPGEPVALLTSLASSKLLKACAEGLGYGMYENAELHGKHIPSLLRIADPAWTNHADHLTHPPDYKPGPTLLSNGIDYTHTRYDEAYVDSVIGPNPPLLTELNIKSTKMFFDRSRLEKTINLSVSLKTEDVSKTLKSWVVKGALAPTSDFFMIFNKIKSNRIHCGVEDSD